MHFKVDTNGDGLISRQELQDCVERLGVDLNKAEIDVVFEQADLNGDGLIGNKIYMLFLKFI